MSNNDRKNWQVLLGTLVLTGGLSALWVVYANPYIGAKETTVAPGCTVAIREAAAFGCIIVQGHGRFGTHDILKVGFSATSASAAHSPVLSSAVTSDPGTTRPGGLGRGARPPP